MSIHTALEGHQDFARDVWNRLTRKMPVSLRRAEGLSFIPYTTSGGAWQPGPFDGICWWTNGFWPAEMWQMYLHTGDAAYRTEAERAEEMLDAAFDEFDHLHHDVGFMWLISSGVNFRLTGNDLSRKRTLRAANMLAGRFNPAGFIRAWNDDKTGWAIIDCMMNLNLLYWASEYTGDPRFRKIAMTHADTVLRTFLREDGSVEHIVCFDPETGAVADTQAGQGCVKGSAWSRGQAWGLYGFTLSYLHTGKAEYLAAARKIADFFIACAAKTGYVPLCDFRQKEDDLFDSCAGAVAACGLIELARATEEEAYLEAAVRILKALDQRCADWSEEEPAILQKCTGAYGSKDHHITMVYADYFFVEAMAKLSGEPLRFW
ncbi:MAG: glycosyl hydrolase family 88 [Aristaeellaceae bacterium]